MAEGNGAHGIADGSLVVVGKQTGITFVPTGTPLTRLNYFDGKFLRAADLTVEQRYVHCFRTGDPDVEPRKTLEAQAVQIADRVGATLRDVNIIEIRENWPEIGCSQVTVVVVKGRG